MNNLIFSNAEISYTPAVVKFNDFEAFKSGIEKVIELYGNYDPETADIKDIKESRKELNKLKEQLETKRKEIKSEISAPYDEFKKIYDGPFDKLDKLISKLKKDIDAYDDHQKKLRRDVVKCWFTDKSQEAALNPKTFDVYVDNFVKASQFKKDSFELKKATIAELEQIVVDEIAKQNQKDSDVAIICDTANEAELGPAVYVRQYESGSALSDVLQLIRQDKQAAEEAKKLLEEKRKAEDERLAKIEQKAKSESSKNIVVVDAETGEIIESKPDEKIYETTIKFTMSLSKAKEFKAFLDSHGIDFETIEAMKEVN